MPITPPVLSTVGPPLMPCVRSVDTSYDSSNPPSMVFSDVTSPG